MSSMILCLGLIRESNRRCFGELFIDCDIIALLMLALVFICEDPIDSKSWSKLECLFILEGSLLIEIIYQTYLMSEISLWWCWRSVFKINFLSRFISCIITLGLIFNCKLLFPLVLNLFLFLYLFNTYNKSDNIDSYHSWSALTRSY